jgi:trans-aconitate methyltransferase
LKFGCGPGLITRPLGYLTHDCRLDGVDIDADMVAWCAEHIPFASFLAASPEPPLPHSPASLDLIVEHGVSHRVPEQHRTLWLTKLQRLLAPGGVTLTIDKQWPAALAATAPSHDDLSPSLNGYTRHRSLPF